MAGDGQSNYDAVPVEEQATYLDSPSRPSSPHYEESTVDHPEDTEADPKGPRLQPLETSLLYRLLRLVFDMIVASITLLFVTLGVWAYKIDGDLAGPDSTGFKLVKAAQYVSKSDASPLYHVLRSVLANLLLMIMKGTYHLPGPLRRHCRRQHEEHPLLVYSDSSGDNGRTVAAMSRESEYLGRGAHTDTARLARFRRYNDSFLVVFIAIG